MAKLTEHERMTILGSVIDGKVTLNSGTVKKLIKDSRMCEALERRTIPGNDPGQQILKYLTDILFLSPKATKELCMFRAEGTLGGDISLIEILNGVLCGLGSNSEIGIDYKNGAIMRFILNRKRRE